MAVNLDSCVLEARVFAVEVGTARRDGGDERQKKADGRMELAEFIVAVKREVQVRTLQVCPAVALAVEDAVVRLVDVVAVVRPQLHFGGVHEGVRGAGQQHGADFFEFLVRAADFVEEPLAESVEGGLGVRALEFEHVAHEFVRKPDIVVFHVRKLVTVLVLAERDVGAGQHLQRFAVHDHEFHFDAEAFPNFVVTHSSLLTAHSSQLAANPHADESCVARRACAPRCGGAGSS